MPDYPEDIQALITTANGARGTFMVAEQALRNAEAQMSAVQKSAAQDCGESQQFRPLVDRCFEARTAEYIYQVCLFNKASQSLVTGGRDTTIGCGRADGCAIMRRADARPD